MHQGKLASTYFIFGVFAYIYIYIYIIIIIHAMMMLENIFVHMFK